MTKEERLANLNYLINEALRGEPESIDLKLVKALNLELLEVYFE